MNEIHIENWRKEKKMECLNDMKVYQTKQSSNN